MRKSNLYDRNVLCSTRNVLCSTNAKVLLHPKFSTTLLLLCGAACHLDAMLNSQRKHLKLNVLEQYIDAPSLSENGYGYMYVLMQLITRTMMIMIKMLMMAMVIVMSVFLQ